jgi:hypothetical protein
VAGGEWTRELGPIWARVCSWDYGAGRDWT